MYVHEAGGLLVQVINTMRAMLHDQLTKHTDVGRLPARPVRDHDMGIVEDFAPAVPCRKAKKCIHPDNKTQWMVRKFLSQRTERVNRVGGTAAAELAVAEADLAVVQSRLQKTRIEAPFRGVVGAREVSVGTYLRAGEPITELAKQMSSARFGEEGLVGPYRGEVEQDLERAETFVTGIEELLSGTDLQGWEGSYETLAGQLRDYSDWVRAEILPRFRAIGLGVENKYASGFDPVTEADRAAEAAMRSSRRPLGRASLAGR